TVRSLCDSVCWSGRQSEETTRERSCWLCRGDDWRRGVHRLVGIAAVAVELGHGVRSHETPDSLVSHGPPALDYAPPPEVALRGPGGLCHNRRRCAHSAWRRFRHQCRAGAAGCGAGTWAGLVPDDGRDAFLYGAHRGRTRAQPLRKVSLRCNPARWPRWRHGGFRPAHLRSWHPCVLRRGPDTTAAVPRWSSLHRFRDHLADRNDGRAPEAATPVAAAGHARIRNHYTAPAARRVHRISYHRCAARSGPQGPDERGTYLVGGSRP